MKITLDLFCKYKFLRKCSEMYVLSLFPEDCFIEEALLNKKRKGNHD